MGLEWLQFRGGNECSLVSDALTGELVSCTASRLAELGEVERPENQQGLLHVPMATVTTRAGRARRKSLA